MSRMVYRVLVIDDEIDWFNTMSIILRMLGYQPDYASNFEEARQKIEQAEHSGTPYDVATIDINFTVRREADSQGPASSVTLGRQILRYIKDTYPHIACIMISNSEQITPEKALDLRDEYGLDYFVYKDRVFDGDLIHHAIQRALSRTRLIRHQGKKVFISYRRSVSWGQARAITNSLREHKFNVFLDHDNINQGRFDSVIDDEIRNREFFVPLLTQGTFESEWVVKEINKALVLRRNIVPLMVDDFSFDNAPLPDLIRDLSSYNAITIKPEFYEDAIKKLVDRFLSEE